MRSLPCLTVLVLLQGCYLFHGIADEPGISDAMPIARDGGSPMDPTTPGTRPDASIFVPEDVEVPIERPREDVTCDGGDEALTALCGALPIVHLATDVRSGGAGSASDPFGAYADAIAACASGCELRVERGEIEVLEVEPTFPTASCMWISGGWTRSDGEWVASTPDVRTVFRGTSEGLFATLSRLLVERVSIVGVSNAIVASAPSDLLVVRDSDIDAGYSGIAAGGTTGTRICRTRITSGYEGISVSNGASDVVIEGVEIDAEYGGIGVSWGSSSVVIRDSNVRGGYSGVSVSWSSHDVVIEDSTIDGGYEGLGVSWSSSHVVVTGSTIGGCYEAVGVSWESHTVQLIQTATGECTGGAHEERAPEPRADSREP